MTTSTQTNRSTGSEAATGAGSNQYTTSGDVSYAPALAYAMVAKVMSKEVELANELKKIQSEETKDSLNNALVSAKQTKASGLSDGISKGITGAVLGAQGVTGTFHETSSAKKLANLNNENKELRGKLDTAESSLKAGAPDEQVKTHEQEKLKLRRALQDNEKKHKEHMSTKESHSQFILTGSQMAQQMASASGSIAKTNNDAQVGIAQAEQQSYKQMSEEMNSSTQSALSVVNRMTSENFAAATAIRG